MTNTADRADVLLALERRVDAYRLVAVNEGWDHKLAHAYGHKEYVRQRIAAVDAAAEQTITSGYDATGYLRDHAALATQKDTTDV